MTALEMIAEWRRGCSCATVGAPEECPECTRALIDALETRLRLADTEPMRYAALECGVDLPTAPPQ